MGSLKVFFSPKFGQKSLFGKTLKNIGKKKFFSKGFTDHKHFKSKRAIAMIKLLHSTYSSGSYVPKQTTVNLGQFWHRGHFFPHGIFWVIFIQKCHFLVLGAIVLYRLGADVYVSISLKKYWWDYSHRKIVLNSFARWFNIRFNLI